MSQKVDYLTAHWHHTVLSSKLQRTKPRDTPAAMHVDDITIPATSSSTVAALGEPVDPLLLPLREAEAKSAAAMVSIN
jgi:hypothetical protein